MSFGQDIKYWAKKERN